MKPISAMHVAVLWLLAVHLFAVPLNETLLFSLVTSILFVLTSTGIGRIIPRLVQTQRAALIITVVVGTVPTAIPLEKEWLCRWEAARSGSQLSAAG